MDKNETKKPESTDYSEKYCSVVVVQETRTDSLVTTPEQAYEFERLWHKGEGILNIFGVSIDCEKMDVNLWVKPSSVIAFLIHQKIKTKNDVAIDYDGFDVVNGKRKSAVLDFIKD